MSNKNIFVILLSIIIIVIVIVIYQIYSNIYISSEHFASSEPKYFKLSTDNGLYLDTQTPYTSHNYTTAETNTIYGGVPEQQICNASGSIYTHGYNANYDGCGLSYCCKATQNFTAIVNKRSDDLTQQWYYNSDGAIINRSTNLYLTIDKDMSVNNARIYLEQFNSKAGQLWDIEEYGYIRSRLDSTFVITIDPKKTQSNAIFIHTIPTFKSEISSMTSTSSANKWQIEYVDKTKPKSLIYNFLNRTKNLIQCSESGKIENYPDFDKYMLKTDCKNIQCISPS